MNGTLPEHRASALHLGATGLLLLVAAVTTGWLALNFVYPDFETFGIRRVVTRVIIHATILIGLWLALSRTTLAVPFASSFGLSSRFRSPCG